MADSVPSLVFVSLTPERHPPYIRQLDWAQTRFLLKQLQTK